MSKEVICKYCGENGLYWINLGTEDDAMWRLEDEDGVIHHCGGSPRSAFAPSSDAQVQPPAKTYQLDKERKFAVDEVPSFNIFNFIDSLDVALEFFLEEERALRDSEREDIDHVRYNCIAIQASIINLKKSIFGINEEIKTDE